MISQRGFGSEEIIAAQTPRAVTARYPFASLYLRFIITINPIPRKTPKKKYLVSSSSRGK